MLCQDRFLEIYKKLPESLAFCPYRVCPLGAHSDHNLGKVTGLAIDKGIYLAPSQFEAMFLSAAHSSADLEQTLAAAREALG